LSSYPAASPASPAPRMTIFFGSPISLIPPRFSALAMCGIKASAAALRLRKVLLEVAADNPRTVELYRRAGFQTEGVLRRQLARPEGFVDVIVMAFFFE